MPSAAHILESYFSVIIGFLWVVILKVLKAAGLMEREEMDKVDEGSNRSAERKENATPDIFSECYVMKSNIPPEPNVSTFEPNDGDCSAHFILNSQFSIHQHDTSKAESDVGMVSDSNVDIAEPNSTNYTSAGGKC